MFDSIIQNPQKQTGSTQRKSMDNLEKLHSIENCLPGSLYNDSKQSPEQTIKVNNATRLSEEILNSETQGIKTPPTKQDEPKSEGKFDILSFLRNRKINNLNKKLLNKTRRSGLMTMTQNEEVVDTQLSKMLVAEKNDTLFNMYQQHENNPRNFRTSFDEILLQNKQAMADLYSSARSPHKEREFRHKKIKIKKKFLNMKNHHYNLFRKSIYTLLGFRETEKTLALFFKAKLGNTFGIVSMLRKLDHLFIRKLALSVSESAAKVHPGHSKCFRDLPTMRHARRRLRRNPISPKFRISKQ